MRWLGKQRRAIRQSEIAKMARPFGPVLRGSRARQVGQSPVNCPYVLGSTEHTAWMTGWYLRHDREVDR